MPNITYEAITPVKLAEAVRNFILTFAYPKFEPNRNGDYMVFAANVNRMTLPPDTEDWATFQVLNQTRRGTNVEEMDETPNSDVYHIAKQVTSDVQIDFYSKDENTARLRAEGLELLCNGTHGTSFFEQYGISLCYADEVKNITGVGSTRQYIQRYSLTIKIVYYAMYNLTQEYATAVNVYTENVDVHHPVNQ